MPLRSILAGVGAYLPERVVSNDELARTVETSDEWIRERTGIRQRHIAAPHETAAFMGTAAARAALRHAGAEPAEVDAIILATSTPDQAFPATALRVQAALGVTRRVRLRPRRGLRRLHLRAVGGRQHDPHRPGARRAGDRQRGLLAHPELAGPRHLRAVRRRRGRGVPARRQGQRQYRPRHPLHPSACPGNAGRHPVCGWRGGAPRPAGPSGDERPRGVPPRGDAARRGGGRGARRQRADAGATSTGWCRTRPICGSSMRWAASSDCRRSGW